MTYLEPVNSPTTAATFLQSLFDAGLLFHCEENTYECLEQHNLGTMALNRINSNMSACFTYLPDPCETALAILNA